MFTVDLLFVGFSVNLILSSYFTVTATNSVIALMGLIFAFLNTFCLFFLMELEFIGLLFLIVYVGAISVLFLFSIMLFNLKDVIQSKTLSFVLKNVIYILLLIIVCFAVFNYLDDSQNFYFPEVLSADINSMDLRDLTYINFNYPFWPNLKLMFEPQPLPYLHVPLVTYNEIHYLGQVLYERYIVYLVLTSLVLLISMIGAVTLINNPKEQIQIQHISKQISRSIKIRNLK